MNVLPRAILAGALLAAATGCGRKPDASAPAGTQLHRSVPPHGGTPIALGDDYRLELVRDAGAGTLSAYLLDDEMEEFIRIPAPSLSLIARVGGEDRPLVLSAVANSATGETVGNTSLFQGQAEWLKTMGSFDGTLQGLTVRGSAIPPVSFHFPSGE
jgi:hypothetical protein